MNIGDLVRYTATNDRMIGVIVKLGEMIRGKFRYSWAKVVWSVGASGDLDEVLIKDLELLSESR